MKQRTLSSYIRPDILAINPYTAVPSLWKKTDDRLMPIIKLDAGENPYGCSPAVLRKLKTFSTYNVYPDPEYRGIRNAIGNYTNSNPSSILVGNGSDELLDILLRAIINDGDEIINCPPTFGMYEVLIRLNKGAMISVPRNANFSININDIRNAINSKTKAIIICSPNNPTGNTIPIEDIQKLLQTGLLIIVDEAYFEFSDQTVLPLLSKFSNLIVLRTLSKWAGLAGLRLGYLIADQMLITQLIKIKPPYNVNTAAVLAGRATLENPQLSTQTVKKIIIERERLQKQLTQFPSLTLYPSKTNSLFIQINDRSDALQAYLLEKNIAVRWYKDPTRSSAIRLTIGTPNQNKIVLACFKTFFMMTKTDSIIFDMDGVLIDNNAYEKAIILSVRRIVQNRKIKTTLVSSYSKAVKSVPQFNNDWDTAFAIVSLIKKDIPPSQVAAYLKPLTPAMQNSASYAKLKDVFQCYYLGTDLFEKTYDRPAPFFVRRSLITTERCLINFSILDEFKKRYALSIATSRPRMEALFAIQNAGLTKYFPANVIIAREDVRKEKPSPEPLLTAQKRLGRKISVYVGDTINDVLAAKQAKILSIIVGTKTKGDFCIKTINNLAEVLL